VKHGAGIEQFGIKAKTAALTGERAPVMDAARVVEQQRRFGVPDEFRYFPRELAVGNVYAPLLCWISHYFRMKY
jgi:hypothetical protein